ncbi:MAG: inositol phosphorylceramide synthase [Holophagales bacterium]|nr:inositol phosphorylceramide synthase [Holophagales bacterium]
MERFVTPSLTEWLMFCYVIYVPLYPVLCGILQWKRGAAAVEEYFFTLGLANVLCDVGFILFPVASPMYWMPDRFRVPLEGWAFTWAGELIRTRTHFAGGSIPSPHAAAATVMWLMAWKHHRTTFWILSPVILSLYVSTVYGRFHYATDAVVGIATGVLAAILARRSCVPGRRLVSGITVLPPAGTAFARLPKWRNHETPTSTRSPARPRGDPSDFTARRGPVRPQLLRRRRARRRHPPVRGPRLLVPGGGLVQPGGRPRRLAGRLDQLPDDARRPDLGRQRRARGASASRRHGLPRARVGAGRARPGPGGQAALAHPRYGHLPDSPDGAGRDLRSGDSERLRDVRDSRHLPDRRRRTGRQPRLCLSGTGLGGCRRWSAFAGTGRADPYPGYRPPRLRRHPDHPDRQLGPLGGEPCPTLPHGSFGLVRAPRHLRNRRPRRVRLVGKQRRVRKRLVSARMAAGWEPYRYGRWIWRDPWAGRGSPPSPGAGRRTTTVAGPSRGDAGAGSPSGRTPAIRVTPRPSSGSWAVARAGPSPSPRAGSSAGSRSGPGSRSTHGGTAPVRGRTSPTSTTPIGDV